MDRQMKLGSWTDMNLQDMKKVLPKDRRSVYLASNSGMAVSHFEAKMCLVHAYWASGLGDSCGSGGGNISTSGGTSSGL